jgi:hypothetical protein
MQPSVVVRALLVGALVFVTLSASAQQVWKWRDASGQMHISDQPPPAGVAVLQKPSAAPATEAPVPAASAPAAVPSAPKAMVDPELAKRKAEADKKKAAADQAQKESQKAAEAVQCAAAKEQLRTLNSGVRLMRVNEKGEREYLDDATKAAQAQQAQAVVDKTCH